MTQTEKTGIRILCVTAVLLLIACIFAFRPNRAQAQTVTKDRDYILVTSPMISGGDALYVTDTRTGITAVLVYDPNQRAVVPKAFQSVPAIFAAGRR